MEDRYDRLSHQRDVAKNRVLSIARLLCIKVEHGQCTKPSTHDLDVERELKRLSLAVDEHDQICSELISTRPRRTER